MDGSVFTRERPVFVAADNRRARRLRYGGAAAALLACLWVAALAVGMLGTGRLPGLSLPSGVRGAERERAPAKAKPSSERSRVAVAKAPTARLAPRVATRSEPVRRSERARRSSATPARRAIPIPARNVAEPASPVEPAEAPPVTPPAPAPAPAPAPPPPKQGWARQGYAAPPGETRRIEARQPAAPPAPAPAQPQPAPAPPGQQKKTEDPNPKG